MIRRGTALATSYLASSLRLFCGARAGRAGRRPARPIALYEFEGCPFCRKVREALTLLDLDAMIYPCPKGGPRFRVWVKAAGGKAQFPYLVDPNRERSMYESDDILAYLFSEYGRGGVPWWLSLGPLTTATESAAGLVRGGAGTFYRPARAPEEPLELYSYEAHPPSRLVREMLSVHELPYRLISVGLGSPKREALRARAGRIQLPYLVDPNSDTALFGATAILDHLERTYAA